MFGVLIVQQQEPRRYDESEEAFLVTLATQLAAIIAHAEATGAFRLYWKLRKKSAMISCIPVCQVRLVLVSEKVWWFMFLMIWIRFLIVSPMIWS